MSHLNPVQLITDELLQNYKVNWPHRNSSPLNEFKIEYLATMAFPTLFPDGEGDPTNSATMRDVTLRDKIKHFIKFAEYNNGKWTYRFANHPRFAYWAFNMIQRDSLLSQGNIFLKQNPGDAPGGVLKNVLYGEAPPRVSTPYPFIYHFFQKRHPFRIPFIGKRHPFHIPS